MVRYLCTPKSKKSFEKGPCSGSEAAGSWKTWFGCLSAKNQQLLESGRETAIEGKTFFE